VIGPAVYAAQPPPPPPVQLPSLRNGHVSKVTRLTQLGQTISHGLDAAGGIVAFLVVFFWL
jgi:hypothetical protein